MLEIVESAEDLTRVDLLIPVYCNYDVGMCHSGKVIGKVIAAPR